MGPCMVLGSLRKLNNVTVGDSHPLPSIVDILDQLGRAKYFSTIDLASGYYQVPTDERDVDKTAFSTEDGHYQFSRMPMGLKNSAATFQRLMYIVLSGLLGSRCFVYLDDIVIYAESIEQHSKKLREVFSQLRSHEIKMNQKKCQFLSRRSRTWAIAYRLKVVDPTQEKLKQYRIMSQMV